MAAYAALVSLMTVIDGIQQHLPKPPITLNKQQAELLRGKISFLQDFLEGYTYGGSKDASTLEARIADAAYEAEDVIECQIVNQVGHGEGDLTYVDSLHQDLQKVITDMDIIEQEVMEIKHSSRMPDQTYRQSIHVAGSVRSSFAGQKNDMVGLEDVLPGILDQLTRHQITREVLPITGMGGIGKTTLAENIYENSFLVNHFDVRAWINVSQEYNIHRLLLEALLSLDKEDKEALYQMSEEELQLKLHKTLLGRRYLIIMDDVWSIEAWDEIQRFFPENYDGSRIVMTTRLLSVALQSSGSHGLEMSFLDEDRSWRLFCKTVFDEAPCPPELEEVGKKIVENCKGLPLSIVVIGGLLAKSERTHDFWEYVEAHLNTIVNLEDNQSCLRILQISYKQLPVHLKPCFLYIAVFPEDKEITVSWLIKLWIAEGFLKPITGKSLEEAAGLYLKDLVERNLILVHQKGSTGKIKLCKIHDLLRVMCLVEAEKDRFLRVIYQRTPDIITSTCTTRRLAINETTHPEKDRVSQSGFEDLPSTPLTLMRSLISNFNGDLPRVNCKLLRVLKTVHDKYDRSWTKQKEIKFLLREVFLLVNSRFLALTSTESHPEIPSSVNLLWNLNTIICVNVNTAAPPEIWKMPQLRHVEFGVLSLPNLPEMDDGDDNDIILGNLQTLQTILNLNFSERVVRKIPNIKKLGVVLELEDSHFGVNNLACLLKLESLSITVGMWLKLSSMTQKLEFPHSLKKLTLFNTNLSWEDLNQKVGSLPHLEVLKLRHYSFVGSHWETVEGHFCSLKFLYIHGTSWDSLVQWTTESTDFPQLEHLHLENSMLEEIPNCIGDIPTLQSIRLVYCKDSLVRSAQELIEEQRELGNEELQLRVKVFPGILWVDSSDD